MAPLARSPRTASLPLLQETSGSLPELVQSSTGPDLAAALTWRQGASSLGKQFLGLNGKEKLLLLTGSVLPWVLCILVDLGLFTHTRPSTVQERTILSTRWFSRDCFCFYLPTKCFLAVCFWRQLPCSPDLSSVGCCLSSLPKQSFSSFDSIFCFQLCHFVCFQEFLFFFFYSHLEISPDTREGSRSPPGLRIPSFSFQILSNILLAAVTGHRTKYWWYRRPPAVMVCQP